LDSFCKQNWKTLATVSYTASASSPELTASVVSWTAYAMKNVYIKQQNCKQMQKQQMHSSSNDLQTSAIPLFGSLLQVSEITAIEMALEKTKLGEPRGRIQTSYSPNSALSQLQIVATFTASHC
jgi:hypothetical protein